LWGRPLWQSRSGEIRAHNMPRRPHPPVDGEVSPDNSCF
jgi:hypothetical protein